MIEVVDLLYKNPHDIVRTPDQEASMKHLLLEEVINGATVNPQLQRDIYDLISVPEPDPENIMWRRDILDDFLSNPALFDDLRSILGIYDEICKGMRNATRGGGSAVVSKKELTGRDSQIFKMRSYADCIVRTIEMYEEAAKVFKPRRLMSEAFCRIKDFVNRELRKDETVKLKKLAAELAESITLDTSFIISMDLNKYFCVEDVEMLELDSNPYNYKDPKKREGFDPKARIEYIGFDSIDDGQLRLLAEKSIARLCRQMEHIVNELKRPFEKISRGIYFYRFGIGLENKIRELGLPVCLPSVDAEDKRRFECSSACDLWLAMNMKKNDRYCVPGDSIVANDIYLGPTDGSLVITGKNNAGKTVFLRTIGIIQVLAQAGLPVPAETCYISPVHGLYAYFTAMDTGNGRFEDEVKSISSMLDIVSEGDLVLLNEAFQSTAYEEAADVLCNVLAYAAASGFRCVSVTHLPGIKEHMRELEGEFRLPFRAKFAEAAVDSEGKPTHKIDFLRG